MSVSECLKLLLITSWATSVFTLQFLDPFFPPKPPRHSLAALSVAAGPQQYSQSPCSEAHADHAATRLRTSTWVMVPGGTGAGARGGGGMALSALDIILEEEEKAHK